MLRGTASGARSGWFGGVKHGDAGGSAIFERREVRSGFGKAHASGSGGALDALIALRSKRVVLSRKTGGHGKPRGN